MSWSYVGHVVAIVLDKSPIAYRQGHYSLVGCCVYPDMSPGGQLVDRRIARGYPEVGSSARRRLDVTES
ncbi:hypothetical protein B296_00022712 [Ensete ventricosum]|uniref:Uncharacterized protein n=1 Tax=Ensete ventricosum TaxID=4639 RepID=A0A427AB50_ENSVE|nr:hypothetical protein B296_00022712 [Ensete ventricosum]